MNSQSNQVPGPNRASDDARAKTLARLNELLEQGEISPEAYAEYSTTADAALSASLENSGHTHITPDESEALHAYDRRLRH
jgi:hypothetical protein